MLLHYSFIAFECFLFIYPAKQRTIIIAHKFLIKRKNTTTKQTKIKLKENKIKNVPSMLRWRQTSGTTHRMTLNTITNSISDITHHTLWYQTSGIRQPTSDNTHHGVDWHHTPSIAVWCDIRYHTLWCRLVSVWTDTRQYTSRCRHISHITHVVWADNI